MAKQPPPPGIRRWSTLIAILAPIVGGALVAMVAALIMRYVR